MQETASKFLFDHNSQSNWKFEEHLSFSPFNTRFSHNNNFDNFLSKYNAGNVSNMDEMNFSNIRSMRNLSNYSFEKHTKPKFEESIRNLLSVKETPTTISNKETPTDNKTKNIILQTTDSSNQRKKKGKKKTHENFDEDDEKSKLLLKHSITKLRKSKQPVLKSAQADPDAIYLRLYPRDLTTKQLMMKLNNFPRLEIKTSKKAYLKKVVDHLKGKWLSKLGDTKFHVIIKPNPSLWLRDLDQITPNLNFQEEVAPLPESYMLSDIWSGYNEPDSHKIELYYEIREIPVTAEVEDMPSSNVKKEPLSRKQTAFFGNLAAIKTKEEISQQEKSMKIEPLPGKIINEKFTPFSGTDYFASLRKSASLSRMSEKSLQEGKSNGSSGFSFNEAGNNKESNSKGIGFLANSNDQSVRNLYNQLEKQFPDDSKFTSQLAKPGQPLISPSLIKTIPVKRKEKEGK